MNKKFFQSKVIVVALFLVFIGVCGASDVFACDSSCGTDCEPCTPHTCKQCVGNVVYWFDSCGNKEDLFQTCTSKQICQYTQCVDIACSTNADCGTNEYVGSPFCQSENVYQDYKTYTCNNPGTLNSSCSNSIAPKLKTTCGDNQTCSNGSCVNIVCDANSDCGTNVYVDSPFCQSGKVYQNYKTYTCNNPGTTCSSCSNSTAPKLKQTCGTNQICSNGACTNIACTTNANCGTNGYVGSPSCQSGNVYQDYKTYTCNNPGTLNSSCTNSTSSKLKTTCGTNQICSNGACTNITCTTNANCGTNGYVDSPFCQSGNVYQNYKTYICNNPGTANSSCTNSTAPQLKTTCGTNQTCSGGACVNNNIVCDSNSDCGTNGYVDSPFCQSGNVYQNYKTYTCNNPGTANSSCTNSTAPQLKTTCGTNQTCSNGTCNQQNNLSVSCYATPNPVNTNQDVLFIATPSNGQTYYSYQWSGACSGISYNCHNSFSQVGTHTASVIVTSTSTGQTASTNCSVVVNQGCTPNYQQKCVGNSVYWFDSCGAQKSLIQNCSYNETCSNGSCIDNCTYHYSQKCVNNNLYWFDSCNNRQEISQYCQNGCQNDNCITQYINVQTNSATNNYSNQATLNGYVYGVDSYSTNYVWFQWGTSTSYGYETIHQTKNYSGSFNQNIANLTPGTTYHFRAVAQSAYGSMVYGSDMTFTVGSTNQTGDLISVSKIARNLSSGSLNWSNTVYASPSDILMFMITVKATGNQNITNATIKDIFPSNLIYKNNLTVSGINNYSGDITSLMNLGTISAGQTATIIYQAQVASPQYFSFGTTTLNNSVSLNSSEINSASASNVAIIVTKTATLGATTISTGLTNNFLVDSFFLPLMVALICVWLFKSDIFGLEKWIDGRKARHNEYRTEKQLKAKITQIKQGEKI